MFGLSWSGFLDLKEREKMLYVITFILFYFALLILFYFFFSSNKFAATVSNKHWLNGSLCIKGVFAEPPVAQMMAEGKYRAI